MKGTALITGGAKRIGRAVALSLAGKGYNIGLHYHSSQADAESAASDIRSKGVECELFQCDLSHSEKVAMLIPRVFDRFPECNLLVNNASVFQRARLMETDEALFDRHFNTNLKAPFFLSRDFARLCRKGHVINILDTKISRTLVEYFAYTLTKKALYEFTCMAAKELGPSIRVNGVSPGLILPSADLRPEDFEKMGDRVPLKTTGNPESIVSAIHFLIDNTFITGECIFVDGGEHLK